MPYNHGQLFCRFATSKPVAENFKPRYIGAVSLFGSKKEAVQTASQQPGQFGPYYLRELIDSGGMANIWLATDSAGQQYALRRLHENLQSDSTAKKRFISGCEVLSKIHNHDCVIGYYEHGKIDGSLYLLMEFVQGWNLKLMYSSHDQILLDNVGNIIIDMATGLEHVHESGFMHLDFKPENVLITLDAGVRVADFDLAQPIPKAPKKLAKNPGTPAYMAPEQLMREGVDQRADIFALGVSMFELLTNYKPFPGEHAGDILAKQRDRSGFITPRQHNPDLPMALEKVVLNCLQQDPEKRYPSMAIVTHELKAALYV
jgi:serine/threonine protein kinase